MTSPFLNLRIRTLDEALGVSIEEIDGPDGSGFVAVRDDADGNPSWVSEVKPTKREAEYEAL